MGEEVKHSSATFDVLERLSRSSFPELMGHYARGTDGIDADAVVAALDHSQAEVTRLREALRPFAEAADVFAREYPAMLDKPATSCGIRFDALQAARSAFLEGS